MNLSGFHKPWRETIINAALGVFTKRQSAEPGPLATAGSVFGENTKHGNKKTTTPPFYLKRAANYPLASKNKGHVVFHL